MSTETFLVLRCDAFQFEQARACENSITTSLSDPTRARNWARQKGWTVKQESRPRKHFRDLCPDHTYLR